MGLFNKKNRNEELGDANLIFDGDTETKSEDLADSNNVFSFDDDDDLFIGDINDLLNELENDGRSATTEIDLAFLSEEAAVDSSKAEELAKEDEDIANFVFESSEPEIDIYEKIAEKAPEVESVPEYEDITEVLEAAEEEPVALSEDVSQDDAFDEIFKDAKEFGDYEELEEFETSEEFAEPEAFEEAFADDETSEDAEAPEVAEKSTDEVIEEFIRSTALGVEFTGMMEEAGVVREDSIPEAVFAAQSDVPPSEEILPSEEDFQIPENIDDIELNTADDSGVGTTDMNLRIAFGIEEEIDDSDEVKEAVKKLGDHLESDRRVGKKYTAEHPEYTDPIQARDIAGEYKKRKRNVTIRLIFAILATLALVVFENITVITELITGSPMQFAGAVDPAKSPVVYVMVSLQLMFIAAIFALPELKHGLKRLFSGSPTPESISLLVVLVGAISSAIVAYAARGTVEPVTYNAVAAMSVVMSLIYSRLNVKREFMTFFIIGSKKKKYAMSRVPDDESLLDPADYDDDMYGDVMRVERTGFVDGFFSRMGTPDGMTTAFVAGIMGVSVAASILFGIFAGRGNAGMAVVAGAVYLAILALTPFAIHLTFSYPFYRASKAAAETDSAIVGETSLDEYSETAVVSFDDGNVFPSYGVKVQNIRIYNNARIDRVLYYASSVFKNAGGPLSDVFEVATMEMGRSEDVEILDADKGYLAAKVDGVNIVFGGYVALAERGYDIPADASLDDVDFSDELSIMYMFREDMLIAKMYIKYVLDGDIESMLIQFKEYGMYVCVRTYDPNIDEDMILAKLDMKDPPVKVVRYRSADDVRGYVERVDSGFVTCTSPKTLLQLLPYCDKTIHTKRTCGALAIMSMIISLMLIAVFAVSSGLEFIRSIHVILWHFVWMIPAYLASKIFIR